MKEIIDHMNFFSLFITWSQLKIKKQNANKIKKNSNEIKERGLTTTDDMKRRFRL